MGLHTFIGQYRRMRTNVKPDFCPVCQDAIKKVITFYTGE